MRLADFSIFYSSILGLSLSMLWVAYCYRSTARIINGTHIHHKINYFIKCGCSTVNFPRKGVGKNIVPLNINLKIYRSIFFCVVRYSWGQWQFQGLSTPEALYSWGRWQANGQYHYRQSQWYWYRQANGLYHAIIKFIFFLRFITELPLMCDCDKRLIFVIDLCVSDIFLSITKSITITGLPLAPRSLDMTLIRTILIS